MNIERMREAIKAAYPHSGKRFARIVDEYPDDQVIAVYKNLKMQEKVK